MNILFSFHLVKSWYSVDNIIFSSFICWWFKWILNWHSNWLHFSVIWNILTLQETINNHKKHLSLQKKKNSSQKWIWNKIINRIVNLRRETFANYLNSQTSSNVDTQPSSESECFAFIRRIKDEDEEGVWCYPSNSIKLLIRQLPSDNVGTNEITKTWQTIWAALPVLYNFVIVAGGSCRIKAQRREPVHRSQSKINSAMPRDSSSTPVSVGSRSKINGRGWVMSALCQALW